MLNEFEYCKRLFYLEWVNGSWSHNPDTVEGSYVHRVVDAGGGKFEGPEEENPVKLAKSVSLGSEKLGLIAKADIIESSDGRVVPVEVKRGKPPLHGPAWTPELVQLCAIGLLLQENGYECTEGQIYFNETRERVDVEFDERLVSQTKRLILELREVAASDTIPPPLVDSPKCPRCSLVGICLPDETNLHAKRASKRPRRLTPRDPAARPLYVSQQGAKIGIRSGRVTVTLHKKEIESVRMLDVSQINVLGNVQLSSQLMRAAFDRDVPVCWFSYGGWFKGIATGHPSKHVELRRRQVAVAAQAGLPIAQNMVRGKIKNCRTLLRRNSRSDCEEVLEQLNNLADQASDAPSIESLLGVEGTAGRLYFSHFSKMLASDDIGTFELSGRNRRPPQDPVNCLLSYAYSLLTKDLTSTLIGVGFDPYLGVYHKPRFGRPALALDLAEEFRPLVADSVVITAINNGEIRRSGFVVRARGVALTSKARRSFIAAYERRLEQIITHPIYHYRISYRRVFEVQARMLGAHLLGEVPHYVPFMTR